MAETASEFTTIAASPEKVWEIAVDFEKYPEWAHDVKEVVILARDEGGRATQVEYRAAALGRSTHYTLEYDYSQAPAVLSWRMLKGDIQKQINGSYHFSEHADGGSEGGTDVRYDLAVELVVPIPGFVKRRAEVRILNTLKELKVRAETT
jgi:uncharacterized protein YndB with AHSA1/START domain